MNARIAAALNDVDDAIAVRVNDDPAINHEAAARVGDHVLDAIDEVRQRHGDAPPPPNFVGWSRPPGGRWQRITTGVTEADAWRAMLSLPPTNGDKIVLPVGQHPDARHP